MADSFLTHIQVPPEDKFAITRTGLPNCYRMVIRYGYAEQVLSKELGSTVYNELRKYIRTELQADGRSSAIADPREGPVLNTMAHRLEGIEIQKPSEDDLKLPKKRIETDDSGASKAVPAAENSIENNEKPTVVDMNERDRRLHAVDEAYKQQVLYVVGKTEL